MLDWQLISNFSAPQPSTTGQLASDPALNTEKAALTDLPTVQPAALNASAVGAPTVSLAVPTAVTRAEPHIADSTAVTASAAEPSDASPSAAFSVLLPQLDAAWGADTPNTVHLLDDFLARYPDYAPAKDKLYAALIAHADELRDAGEIDAAVTEAQRASSLLPDRAEAQSVLDSLAPTPVSESTIEPDQPTITQAPAESDSVQSPATTRNVASQPARVLPTPAPRPTPRSVPAVDTQPVGGSAQVATPVPLPTKVPFIPPRP
jgi:hypothetical protein